MLDTQCSETLVNLPWDSVQYDREQDYKHSNSLVVLAAVCTEV
jgi:hypothetical protein